MVKCDNIWHWQRLLFQTHTNPTGWTWPVAYEGKTNPTSSFRDNLNKDANQRQGCASTLLPPMEDGGNGGNGGSVNPVGRSAQLKQCGVKIQTQRSVQKNCSWAERALRSWPRWPNFWIPDLTPALCKKWVKRASWQIWSPSWWKSNEWSEQHPNCLQNVAMTLQKPQVKFSVKWNFFQICDPIQNKDVGFFFDTAEGHLISCPIGLSWGWKPF